MGLSSVGAMLALLCVFVVRGVWCWHFQHNWGAGGRDQLSGVVSLAELKSSGVNPYPRMIVWRVKKISGNYFCHFECPSISAFAWHKKSLYNRSGSGVGAGWLFDSLAGKYKESK